MGQYKQRHYKIDANDDDQRQDGEDDRRPRRALIAVGDLGRIERARGRRPLPDDQILRGITGGSRRCSITFALAAGFGLGAGEPP